MVLTVIKREEGNPQRQSHKATETMVWRITHLSDYPSLDKWEDCVRKGIWQEPVPNQNMDPYTVAT